jgi:triacylglycerol lipase
MTPIVLHHGLLGYDEFRIGRLRLPYFLGIDRAIADRGYPVIVSRVHPTGGIERRAREFKTTILRQLKAIGRERDRVVVLAHSMGGLDARYMLARLGMADNVKALVTVCTPHRGSPYADWCLKHLGQRLGGLQLANFLGFDVQALQDLTTAHCAAFNGQIPDAPGVRYFSVSAARPWHRVPPFAIHAFRVVQAAEGDNDSLVSVRSSTWGEHLGVWPADHWHSINHRLVLELKEPTGDIVPYWMGVLDRLADEGIIERPAAARDAKRKPARV